MTHKKEYTVDGDKISKYNKDYYQKHRAKLLHRANTRNDIELYPGYKEDMEKLYKKWEQKQVFCAECGKEVPISSTMCYVDGKRICIECFDRITKEEVK